MTTQVSEPIIMAPSEGKVYSALGQTIVCKVSSMQTGGSFSVLEETTPPQAGVKLHTHAHHEELFYVLDGEYEVTCGDRTFTAKKGSVFAVPKDVPHASRNTTSSTSKMLIVMIPGGSEEVFDELERSPSSASSCQIANKYDTEFPSCDD
jgi:quercetin dioxygenase-like cupin family protein